MAHNPFPRLSPLDGVLLGDLCKVAKECYQRSWSWGTAGNFSLRGSAPHIIWQSPSGVMKNSLDVDQFIPVFLANGNAVEPGNPPVSGEMPVHLGIYRTIASAKAVVHCHPPHLVAASASREEGLLFQGEEMQKALGFFSHSETIRLPVVANVEPEAMPEFADKVGDELEPEVPMVILQKHGVYAWGRSPFAALSYIEAAEYLCQTEILKQ